MAEEDVVLRISTQDDGAARLVASLKKAIEDLSAARQSDNAEAIKAAKEQVKLLDALLNQTIKLRQQEEAAAKDRDREAQRQLANLAKLEAARAREAQATIRAQERAAAAQERAQKTAQRAADAAARQSEKEAAAAQQQLVRDARAGIKATETLKKVADDATLERIRRENAARKEAARIAQQFERDRIRIARQVEASNRQAANDRLKAERQAAREAAAADAARLRSVRALESAQRTQLLRQSNQLQTLRNNTSALAQQVVALGAAYVGLNSIKTFIGLGLRFNQTIESSTLGIAALITAEGSLQNASGKTVTGVAALEGALGLAGNQVQKLRIAGIQTAATTEQLVDAYQQAVGAGLKVGLTLDEIRKFTIRAVQAAFALGVPMNQLNQEVRSILDGTIDRNSRVAKALQLTNAEVKLAREHGQLAAFLDDRFKSFELTGEKAITTFAVLRNNLQEALAVFAGDATKPLFEAIRKSGFEALSSVFDFDSARIAKVFSGLVSGAQTFFTVVGRVLTDGIEAAVAAAQELSVWFQNNKELVFDVASGFGEILREVGALVVKIITFPARIAQASTETGLFGDQLRIVAAFVKTVADNIDLILTALIGIKVGGGIAAIIAGGPISVLLASLTAVITLINFLQRKNQQVALEQARRIELTGQENAENIRLAENYIRISKELAGVKRGTTEYADKALELKRAQDDLLEVGGPFADIIKKQGDNAEEAAKSLRKMAAQIGINAALQVIAEEEHLSDLLAQKAVLKQQIGDIAKKMESTNAGDAGAFFAIPQDLLDRLKAVEDEIDVVKVRAESFKSAMLKANEQLKEADQFTVTGARKNPVSANILDNAAQLQEGILSLVKARVKTETQIIERQFNDLEITEKQKLEALAKLQEDIINAEIALRQRRITSTTDVGVQDRARAEIRAFEEQRQALHEKTNNDIAAADKEFFSQKRSLSVDLLEAEGKDVEAAAERLGAQYADLLAKALRENDDTVRDAIFKIIGLGTAKAKFVQLERLASQVNDKLDRDLARISNQVDSGALTQAEARKAQARAYQEFHDSLGPIIEQLKVLRDTLGPVDPAFDKALSDLIDKAERAGVSVKKLQSDWFEAGKEINLSIADDLGTAMADVVTQTHSVSEAFRSLATSVLGDIARIIAHMIALKIVESTLGASLFGAVGIKSGGLVSFASGGVVRGSGTSTSDSIPARLSNGEFVIRAKAVERFGPELFAALNNFDQHTVTRRFPGRFAAGGLVAGGASARTTADIRAGIEVGLSEDLVARRVDSRSGTAAVLKVISKNRKTIRSTLQG